MTLTRREAARASAGTAAGIATTGWAPGWAATGAGGKSLSPAAVRIAAAGDIGKKPDSGKATAALIRRINPGLVIPLGDLAYDKEGANYAPWRQFAPITAPVRGNHDMDSNLRGFHNDFGAKKTSWAHYSFERASWRIVIIDTEADNLAEEVGFIRRQRAKYPSAPMLVAGHKPFLSSGSSHGGETGMMRGVWKAAVESGVSVGMFGHDHHGEVFEEQDGLRLFVAGTGGAPTNAPSRNTPGTIFKDEFHGVLVLDLSPGDSPSPRRTGGTSSTPTGRSVTAAPRSSVASPASRWAVKPRRETHSISPSVA